MTFTFYNAPKANRPLPTQTDAARGTKFWRRKRWDLQYRYTQTIGDDNLQLILDRIHFTRQAEELAIHLGHCGENA